MDFSLNIPSTKNIRAEVYRQAGEARYQEALALQDQYPSGAIYLGGYLIECYLKWAVCKRSGVQYLADLPDASLVGTLTSGTGHNLEKVAILTAYDAHLRGSNLLKRAFQIASSWSPNARYVVSCGDRERSTRFLAAIRRLRDDIREWANG